MRQHVRYGYCAVIVLITAVIFAGFATGDAATHRAVADTAKPDTTKPDTASTASLAIDAPRPATARQAAMTSAGTVAAPTKAAPKKPAPKPIVAREPATPANLPTAIEPLAVYVPQTACEAGFRPGVEALGKLLVKTYPGTSFGGDYACGTDGLISEHYEGRALDWMNSARIPAQAAQATAVLHWLLDPDKHGNAFAIARRLGVMYVIWDNRIWSADTGTWAPYQNCAKTPQASMDSYCHRNHIHISLSWDGAWGRTSFFTGHVFSQTDYGPCRAKDLNWAAPYTAPNWTGCVSYPKLTAAAGMTPIMQGLLSWSGDVITRGSTGPAVMAVQAALKVDTNSVFDPSTARAVVAFQRAHRLPATAIIDAATWRALMAANARPTPLVSKPASQPASKPAATPVTKPALASPAPISVAPKIQPPATNRRPATQPVVGATVG